MRVYLMVRLLRSEFSGSIAPPGPGNQVTITINKNIHRPTGISTGSVGVNEVNGPHLGPVAELARVNPDSTIGFPGH